MKEVGKIYSAVDADELEEGDIVVFADSVIGALDNNAEELCGVKDKGYRDRFVSKDRNTFNLAKLVCPKKHAEVYKAFQSGAKVKYKTYYDPDNNQEDEPWVDCPNPSWGEDEEYCIVEQEPKYRPFKSILELLKTWYKLTGQQGSLYVMTVIWVRGKASQVITPIAKFNENTDLCIYIPNGAWLNMKEMFDKYTFLDGTPFGVREE